jgi:hypothetical protein
MTDLEVTHCVQHVHNVNLAVVPLFCIPHEVVKFLVLFKRKRCAATAAKLAEESALPAVHQHLGSTHFARKPGSILPQVFNHSERVACLNIVLGIDVLGHLFEILFLAVIDKHVFFG